MKDADLIGPGQHLGVSGQTQTGKSYWTQRALELGAFDVIVYDPDDEYAPTSSIESIPEALEAFELAREEDRRAVVVVSTGTYSRGGMADEVDVLARFAYELGDVVLVVDEAGESARRHVMPESLYKCARRGAKRGVGLVVVSQRLCDVDTELTSQLGRHVIFRLQEAADTKHVQGRWGRTVAEKIRSLPDRRYVVMPDDLTELDPSYEIGQDGEELGRSASEPVETEPEEQGPDDSGGEAPEQEE